MMNKPVQVLAENLAFPEGPCVVPNDGLCVSEVEAGWVTRVDRHGVHRWVKTGGRAVGAAIHRDGSLYLCNSGLHVVLRIQPNEDWMIVARESGGEPLIRPNDLAFDRNGVLYFTDPRLDPESSRERPSGMVHRMTPDGVVQPVGGGMAFSNGIAFGRDGALYVAETSLGRIQRWELTEDGTVAAREVFAEVSRPEDGPGGPDGMAFDIDGYLFVAVYGSGRIRIVDPDGRLTDEFDAGGRRPTNICFGGPEGRHVFVTEAETGRLLTWQLDRPGLPLWGDSPWSMVDWSWLLAPPGPI
jgi:gluconolactonase